MQRRLNLHAETLTSKLWRSGSIEVVMPTWQPNRPRVFVLQVY